MNSSRTMPGLAQLKTRAVAYYDAHAEGYDRRVSRGLLAVLRRRERGAVLQLAGLDDPRRARVLDAGCGGGYFSRAAKCAGKWVHAIDAAPGMVERIRPEVDVAEVADLETFAPGRTYDVLLCCGLLEFVANPEVAVQRLARLCAPGARLVLQVPRAGPGGLLYKVEKRLAGLSVVLYQRDALVGVAAAHGLRLAGEAYPLPHNMVLAFDAAG